MCSKHSLWWKAEVCVSSYQHMISAVSKPYAAYHSICIYIHMFLFHLGYHRALGPTPFANVWLRPMQTHHMKIHVWRRGRGTFEKIGIVFLLVYQFCVCIYVFMHMLLSHVYLDSLSGQTLLKLHLTALHRAVQNRESNVLLSLEI